jgi:hypothetical protein
MICAPCRAPETPGAFSLRGNPLGDTLQPRRETVRWKRPLPPPRSQCREQVEPVVLRFTAEDAARLAV